MLPVTASPAAVTVIGHDSSCRAVDGCPTHSGTRMRSRWGRIPDEDNAGPARAAVEGSTVGSPTAAACPRYASSTSGSLRAVSATARTT